MLDAGEKLRLLMNRDVDVICCSLTVFRYLIFIKIIHSIT